jgi:hypothetical protein
VVRKFTQEKEKKMDHKDLVMLCRFLVEQEELSSHELLSVVEHPERWQAELQRAKEFYGIEREKPTTWYDAFGRKRNN